MPQKPAILATLQDSHPRLIASNESWQNIRKQRRQNAELDAFLKRGELEAHALLNVAPIAYKKDGKRLLHVSRVVLRRVLLLSLHFQLSGEPSLARRAEQEMLHAAAFADWNPSHFLDTAEMTMALAFGFDWLFDELDIETRQTIADAIIEKGLRPGLVHSQWRHAQNNWNQVCLAGMSLGALAVAEWEPDLAAQTLEIAKKFNIHGLQVYAPAGVYPEGASYWSYGTGFQVVLLAALESALGTDWNLGQSPGFLPSADAIFQILGPTGAFFNFADGGEFPNLEGATFWFAQKLQRPELALYERARFQKFAASLNTDSNNATGRLWPLAALWWPEATAKTEKSAPKNWFGPGLNPLAVFRSQWNDPNAMFLALKGGHASQSHGHMDAGSWVFESDGVRWAHDLGMQQYLSLESQGVDLWNFQQNGQRWSVFRLNNHSHNTLSINGELHRATGHAQITHFFDQNDAGAIVDLTPVFEGLATRVTRGFAFRPQSHVLIRDELEGLKPGDMVRWAMLTKAQIALENDGQTAILSEKGQKLRVNLDATPGVRWEIVSAESPVKAYDAPNPGVQILTAHFTAPASGKLWWSVVLRPASLGLEKTVADSLIQTELSNWPMAPTERN